MNYTIEQFQEIRKRYSIAYTKMMNGEMSVADFYTVKKEWMKASSEIAKASSQNKRQIEADLKKKYGSEVYSKSLV